VALALCQEGRGQYTKIDYHLPLLPDAQPVGCHSLPRQGGEQAEIKGRRGAGPLGHFLRTFFKDSPCPQAPLTTAPRNIVAGRILATAE